MIYAHIVILQHTI